MIDHPDWNQYQHLLPALKEAKRKVQEALKPGGGGPNSSNIGRILFGLSQFSLSTSNSLSVIFQ